MFTRRNVVRMAGAGLFAGCSRPEEQPVVPPESEPQRNLGAARPPGPDTAPLDQALLELHRTDPEFSGGLSNHGPMACEALEALGATERIGPFFRRYRSRLEPMPATPLLDDWSEARGQPEARAGLIASMEAELRRIGPEALLQAALPLLLPGMVGGAFHGLLRTAHAYRGWNRSSSAPRANELAQGLGYWAARYQPLPGSPGVAPISGRDGSGVLRRVPIVPLERRHAGLIFERFDVLIGDPGFVSVVESYDPEAQAPDVVLDALVLAAARLFVTTGARGASFVYLHGVTGSAALRLLLPVLSARDQRVAVGYLVQALAAVHATHAQADSSATEPLSGSGADPVALATAAARSDDDHTIKLVEAALREYEGTGSAELLVAAAHRLG
ncbi:MAG: hypothetical protein ACRBN8_24840 [Nannocystales bacterium]